MFNKSTFILLVTIPFVLSKSIGDEITEIPIKSSENDVHLSYMVLPKQTLQNNPMKEESEAFISRPTNLYTFPINPEIGSVHSAPHPAYVSILNDPKIKSDFGFIFALPHPVQFHDEIKPKMDIVKTYAHIENLKGKFEDFIRILEKPCNCSQDDKVKSSIIPMVKDKDDVIEVTPAASTETMKTPNGPQEEKPKGEGIY